MNRTEFSELLQDTMQELLNPTANFSARFGSDAIEPAQLELIVAAALTAADRYYSNLTKLQSERRPLEK